MIGEGRDCAGSEEVIGIEETAFSTHLDNLSLIMVRVLERVVIPLKSKGIGSKEHAILTVTVSV